MNKLLLLEKTINDKLWLNGVENIATTIDIVFNNKEILNFKSLEQLESYNFDILNCSTKSISLEWDFFVKINGYEIPQRHTVSVRIASSPMPSDLFKILLSGGFDESHDLDIQSSTMICKVDFINNILAEELINIVSNWNDLCENAIEEKGKVKRIIHSRRLLIASIAEICTIISFCAICAVGMKIFLNDNSTFFYEYLPYFIIFSFPCVVAIKKISHFIANLFYDEFGEIMDIHIFNFTSGDKKMIEKCKINSDVKKQIFWLVVDIIISIILSIIFFVLG